MKKVLSLLITLILLIGMMGALPVSAAGSVNVWVGSTTVTIGNTVTVTIAYNGGGEGIGSLDAKFTYNAEVFEYLSCTGATANGGSGVVRLSYYSLEEVAADTLSITLNFKAIAPGDGNFTLNTEGMYSDTSTLLENATKTVAVSANNPTLSGNANLKSLVPSKGTLTPKFDPNKTEYTIAVANSVNSLTLSAVPEHSGAKTSISGKNALTVGKNTRVITVTAPNGTTKKYTVVITRAAAPSTTGSPTGTNPTGPTQPTIPTPPADALDVSVGDKTLTILDTQASVDLPSGFVWSDIAIRYVEVPAAINRETGMTLLYLTGTDRADNGFYIYDKEADLFTRYRPLDTAGSSYLLYDLPANSTAPVGTAKGEMVYTNHYVSAYVYEDAALSDFYIVWAAPAGGEAGWYTYDKKENTLQRYHATPAGGEGIILPNHDDQKPAQTTIAKKPAATKAANTQGVGEKIRSFFKNIKQPRNLLLLGGIALIVIALLVTIILLIISSGRRKNGKH